MFSIQSFCINHPKDKLFIVREDNKDPKRLFCSDLETKYYINILKDKQKLILGNCHKYIDIYVEYDKNIFNGKIKFNNKSLINNEKIYMAICCNYTIQKISIEMYLLNELPHVMINDDIFFNYSSIIRKYTKNFDIESYKLQGLFADNLKDTLYKLFDLTFTEMLKL